MSSCSPQQLLLSLSSYGDDDDPERLLYRLCYDGGALVYKKCKFETGSVMVQPLRMYRCMVLFCRTETKCSQIVI